MQLSIVRRYRFKFGELHHRHIYKPWCPLPASLCLTLYLSLLGCSDVVVGSNMEDHEDHEDQQGGSNVIFQYGGTATGGMSVTPDVPDTCEFGEDLGLCMICGPNLTPIKPLNDDRCPYVPCESLTRYQALPTEDGGRTCAQYTATPPIDNCKELGICYEDVEDACTVDTTPMTLFTVYPGCGEFTGCDGDISPDASIKPEGSTCHSLGTCDAEGRCSAPSSCEGDKPEYVRNHCPEPNMDEGCDLFVDMNGIQNADDISCTLVCATQNGCLTGWDSNNGCVRGGEIGCTTRRHQLICRCRGN